MYVEPVLALNDDDKDDVKKYVQPAKPSFADLVSALAEDQGWTLVNKKKTEGTEKDS